MKNPVVFASTWITPEAHYRLPLRILPEKNPTSLNTDFSFFRGHYRSTGIHETNSDVKKFTMCVGVKKNVYFLFFLFFFFADLKHCADHLPRWRTGERTIGENYYFSDPN